MEIIIDKLKLGEEICYHSGFLALDRVDGYIDSSIKDKVVRIPTPEAKALDALADEFFRRSNTVDVTPSDNEKVAGTGEFMLYQRATSTHTPRADTKGNMVGIVDKEVTYHYYAKRIKLIPKKLVV